MYCSLKRRAISSGPCNHIRGGRYVHRRFSDWTRHCGQRENQGQMYNVMQHGTIFYIQWCLDLMKTPLTSLCCFIECVS